MIIAEVILLSQALVISGIVADNINNDIRLTENRLKLLNLF